MNRHAPAPIEWCDLFGSTAPFARWSWDTYVHYARRSKNVTRKRAAARWKVWIWEKNFETYAEAGHKRICADCGTNTSPRDPVFDLCRACERQWRLER